MAVTQAGRTKDAGSSARPDPIDLLNIDAHLSEEERGVGRGSDPSCKRGSNRTSKGGTTRPSFPGRSYPSSLNSGLLGMHLSGYGCAGKSAVEYGLACMELEAGDSGLRTFVSVQGSLAMSAIHKFGSEDQKQRWLPPMAGERP